MITYNLIVFFLMLVLQKSGKTVLIYAISKGDHETIQKLLKHNVDINASDGVYFYFLIIIIITIIIH